MSEMLSAKFDSGSTQQQHLRMQLTEGDKILLTGALVLKNFSPNSSQEMWKSRRHGPVHVHERKSSATTVVEDNKTPKESDARSSVTQNLVTFNVLQAHDSAAHIPVLLCKYLVMDQLRNGWHQVFHSSGEIKGTPLKSIFPLEALT